jgi:P-type Ca2+ transporter type 2C
LLVVGVLYAPWGKPGDAVTVLIVILVLVGAEVLNRYRAKRAITALERLSAPKARVRRARQATATP